MTFPPPALAPHPSLWRRTQVADTSRWVFELSRAAGRELARATRALGDAPIGAVTPAALAPFPELRALAARCRSELEDGLGVVLVRGVDVDAFDPPELEQAFALLGAGLGTPVPQNLRGELVTQVRDTGADPRWPDTRLYTTRAAQDFHTDGADVIGLLCRRTARSGGESSLASSGAIVAEVQAREPRLYATLFEDFPWHYQEEGSAPFWFARPICTAPHVTSAGARLNTFFIPWYIERSQEIAEAPRLSSTQREAIALMIELANDERFRLDMEFAPGDVQWLKNAAILHRRGAYEDFAEPDRRRHLLRLWLAAPEFVDGDAQLRGGVTEAALR